MRMLTLAEMASKVLKPQGITDDVLAQACARAAQVPYVPKPEERGAFYRLKHCVQNRDRILREEGYDVRVLI